jgi:hypothetical protein
MQAKTPWGLTSTDNYGCQIRKAPTRAPRCTEGTMDITYFDAQNGIISGIFSMKAISSAGETISIEQGRFDTKF